MQTFFHQPSVDKLDFAPIRSVSTRIEGEQSVQAVDISEYAHPLLFEVLHAFYSAAIY